MLIYIFIGILILKLSVQFFLSQLNDRRLSNFLYADLPGNVKMLFSPELFEKMRAYNLEKSRFSFFSSFFNACLVIAICFPPLPAYLYQFFGVLWWQQALFLMCLLVWDSIWSAISNYLFQFYIEEKHGFNQSSKGLWVKDTIISFVLNIVLMFFVFGVFIYLSSTFELWWLGCFVFVILFGIFMLIISPFVIAPLFNKFSELENSELKEELMSMAKKLNFNAKTILMMDGSKRSKHSNAYFSGLGKFRRIVLYDTLVKQLSTIELKAVLAHEIGHYKKGHVPKSMLLFSLLLFGGFYGLSLVQHSTWVYTNLGFASEATGRFAPLFFFFLLFGDSWTYFINPFFSWFSRKFEYEADAFARSTLGEGKPLVDALGKLTTENMGNPVPHPIYSGFYYSHPTLAERSKALEVT
jgi:STE24 endopeptidase